MSSSMIIRQSKKTFLNLYLFVVAVNIVEHAVLIHILGAINSPSLPRHLFFFFFCLQVNETKSTTCHVNTEARSPPADLPEVETRLQECEINMASEKTSPYHQLSNVRRAVEATTG